MPEPSDDQLADLLRRADRPRALTESEYDRVLARLRDDALTPSGPPDRSEPRPAVHIDAHRPHEQRRRHRRTAVVVGVAAASVIAIAGVVALTRPMADEHPAPVATQVTVPAAPPVWCDRLDELTMAIDRWQGIDNWAFTIGGLPDLAALTGDALDALADGEPDLADEARAASDQLENALAAIDEQSGLRAIGAASAAAERDAADRLVALAEATGACPVDDLATALEL